jgi:hypothetical protein
VLFGRRDRRSVRNYVAKSDKTIVKRTMPNIIAAAFISNPVPYLILSGCELGAQVSLI